MKRTLSRVRAVLIASWLSAMAPPLAAHALYSDDDTHVNAELSATFGLFHSQRSYAQARTEPGSASWQEGVLKYGLSTDRTFGGGGQIYAGLSGVSTGTWGDGDAAGWTDGSEHRTALEDAYLGWRSGSLFPALGENGVDVSFGRQTIRVGDGFLISGDAISFGHGFLGGAFDRGGAYYLAGRPAFDRTVVVRLGGDSGWRGDLMRLESDNAGQVKAKLDVGTLEHVAAAGTAGLTYIKVTDTDDPFGLYPNRDGMKVYSLRGQGNAGVEGLFLSGEYAREKQLAGDESAWYVEAGWSFKDARWTPSVNYRYSHFSEGYDPLFYGNGRNGALGTWFQGEVSANYAGPLNTNARVHHLELALAPSPRLALGALFHRYLTLDRSAGVDASGHELDLYAAWTFNDHLTVIPLLGWYKPERSAGQGGTQLGSASDNLYSELVVSVSF